MRPTPETDEATSEHLGSRSLQYDGLVNLCRKLERERGELADRLAKAMSDFETASMEAYRIRERANANADLLIGVLHDFATFYRGQMTHGMLEMIESALASMNPPVKLNEWKNDYKH